MPFELYDLVAISWPHIVATTTQKRLGSLSIISSLHAVELTDLDDPPICDRLNLLLVATCERERVTEPLACNRAEECTLTDALRPGNSQHDVELTSRLECTAHGSYKP